MTALAPAAASVSAPAAAPGSAPVDAGNPFFPPACAHLQNYVALPATVPANRIVVKAWPLTKASTTQINKMLDYLTKPVRGRDEPAAARRMRAFPEAINKAWMRGLLYHGAAPGSPTPATLMRVFSAGWVPDPESSPSITKGTFWIALSMGMSLSKHWFDQQLRSFQRQAMDYAGITSRTLQRQLMANIALPVLAEGGYNVTADQLKAAAYKSALGAGQFAAFIRTTFSMPHVNKSSRDLARPIEARAKKVVDALAAVGQVENIASGVGAVIGQAREQPDVAAGVQMLVATRREVENVKTLINSGVAAADSVISEGQRIRTQTLGEMKRRILASAEERIRRNIKFTIAREYVRCQTLSQAWRSLGRQFESLLSILMAGVTAAGQLKTMGPQVGAANVVLDDLIERLKKAERELPLSPWLRTTLGVPHWGWAAGGVVALLGGAVGIRRMRKKKRVKKNRRRRRGLTA